MNSADPHETFFIFSPLLVWTSLKRFAIKEKLQPQRLWWTDNCNCGAKFPFNTLCPQVQKYNQQLLAPTTHTHQEKNVIEPVAERSKEASLYMVTALSRSKVAAIRAHAVTFLNELPNHYTDDLEWYDIDLLNWHLSNTSKFWFGFVLRPTAVKSGCYDIVSSYFVQSSYIGY